MVLSLSLSVLLLYKTKELPKQRKSSRFSPLQQVIAEALIGLTLARGGSSLELGELLEAPYRSHASSPLPHYQTPARHKPNTEVMENLSKCISWSYIPGSEIAKNTDGVHTETLRLWQQLEIKEYQRIHVCNRHPAEASHHNLSAQQGPRV